MLRMSDLSFLRTHQCYYERQMVVGRNDNIDATHGHRTKNLILDLKESSSQCDYQFSIISMLEIMSLQVY